MHLIKNIFILLWCWRVCLKKGIQFRLRLRGSDGTYRTYSDGSQRIIIKWSSHQILNVFLHEYGHLIDCKRDLTRRERGKLQVVLPQYGLKYDSTLGKSSVCGVMPEELFSSTYALRVLKLSGKLKKKDVDYLEWCYYTYCAPFSKGGYQEFCADISHKGHKVFNEFRRGL
jgi:hypothetical protein